MMIESEMAVLGFQVYVEVFLVAVFDSASKSNKPNYLHILDTGIFPICIQGEGVTRKWKLNLHICIFQNLKLKGEF